MKRFDSKDPAEVITVAFDFTEAAAAVTAPVVTISVRFGTDASPNAMLLGSPVATGAIVYQRLQGGVDKVDYVLRCLAHAGNDTLQIDCVLPARRRV